MSKTSLIRAAVFIKFWRVTDRPIANRPTRAAQRRADKKFRRQFRENIIYL